MFNMKNGMRFLGHPVHTLLVHFPMGLLPVSLLWDLLAMLTGQAFWWKLGFWSIVVGLSFSVIAAIPGFIDFIRIPEKHPAEKAALFHMSIILIAVGFFIGSLLLRIHDISPTGIKLYGSMGCSLLGLICLMIGGWYGGELVYHHQIGKKSRN